MVRGIDGHRWRRAETLLTGVAGGRREGRAEVQRTAGRRHAGAWARGWARGWRGARGAAGIASNIDREREYSGGDDGPRREYFRHSPPGPTPSHSSHEGVYGRPS